MLASLDKFDHAAVVGCCAHRAEISVALPPKRDGDPVCGVFPGRGGNSESVVEAGVALRLRGV
jgi:hypothetical protein